MAKHLSRVQIWDIRKRPRVRGEAVKIAEEYGITRRHVFRIWAGAPESENSSVRLPVVPAEGMRELRGVAVGDPPSEERESEVQDVLPDATHLRTVPEENGAKTD